MTSEARDPQWHDAPWLRAFFAAVQFLTRIPVPGGAARQASLFAADLRRGLVCFPLIGAGIGALTAAALWGFSAVLPFAVAVLLALAFEAVLTGAFHEDAVADFCDAFGGGWTRDDVLRILKDSRVGSFGVLGLGLAVALRAAGLMALGSAGPASVALVTAGALGRLVIIAVMILVPPIAAREGLGRDLAQDATWGTFGLATLLITPVLVWAGLQDAVALVAAVLALAIFVAWQRSYLFARIGGVTGDCLGFAAYAGIIVTTLAFAHRM